MKQFKVLEDPCFTHNGEKFMKGDIRSHEDGQYFIDLGWAECTDTGKSGKRVEGVSKIQPSDVVLKTKL